MDQLLEFNDEFMSEAVGMMIATYHKIIKVNLTNDRYIPIRIASEEWGIMGMKTFAISRFFDWFANSDYIHPDDREKFLEFVKLDNLDEVINNPSEKAYIIYKRKIGSEYRFVYMGIQKCKSYTDQNKEAIIFIKDIHDICAETYKQLEQISDLAMRNALTRVRNRFSYDSMVNNLHDCQKAIICIYCDVNGLKYVNDNFGHTAGDNLIKDCAEILTSCFRDEEVYHIHGDEFVVLTDNNISLNLILFGLKGMLGEDPIFSFGISCGSGKDIEQIVVDAERKMFQNKKEYYELNEKFRR